MACRIEYRGNFVPLNNAQFSALVEFASEVGAATCRDPLEHRHVDRMKTMRHEAFWPGRDMDIEKDFPDVAERKFWARVFLDTARTIFDRKVGKQEHSFWQAQRIWQAYGTGQLFEECVRSVEPEWHARTVDTVEFNRIVNGIET